MYFDITKSGYIKNYVIDIIINYLHSIIKPKRTQVLLSLIFDCLQAILFFLPPTYERY